jgi:hypothetical protein
MYPPYTTVLGPYKRPDGRQHIVLNNSSASKGTKGKTKTISYPKAIMEVHLNRRLSDNEEVDHVDGNKLNDCFDNYQVITRTENRKKQAKEGNNKFWGKKK